MFIGGIGHRHTRSASSQIKGNGAAQSARSARDDGDSTLKVHRDTSHPTISRETEMIAEGSKGSGMKMTLGFEGCSEQETRLNRQIVP